MKKITFTEISKFYESNHIIKNILYKISLELNIGDMVLIKGKSGSGKTTLLNIISGLEKASNGEIYIDNNRVTNLFEYRKKYVSYVYQDFVLIDNLSVYDNLKIYVKILGIRSTKIDELLNKLNILHLKYVKVSRLSGGEKQRVLIARALLKPSPILIADEPTAFLDDNNTRKVYNLLKEESKKRIVIITSHKLNYIKKYVNKIVTIKNESIKLEIIKENSGNNKENNQYNFKFKEKIFISLKRIKSNKEYAAFVCLMYLFLMITSTYLINTYKKDINYSNSYYNVFLKDYSNNRIIINKKNKSSFNKTDYKKIKKIDKNIIIRDDLLLDETLTLDLNDKKLHLKINEQPSSKNILYLDSKSYKKYSYLKNKNIYIKYNGYTKKIKINSIKKGVSNYIVLSSYIIKELKPYVIINYSDVYLSDRLVNYNYKFCSSIKENVTIAIKAPYFEKNINNALINDNTIEFNKDTFNLNKSYQKSIYIKHVMDIKTVENKLINSGYNTFVVKNSLYSDLKDIISILVLLKKIFILMMVIIINTFVYFIMRVFFKSNNTFYSVLLKLDVSSKEIEEVIFIELFILENISALVFISFLGLSRNIIIPYITLVYIIKKISKKEIINDRN